LQKLGDPRIYFKAAQTANVLEQNKTKIHWRFGLSTTSLHQGAEHDSELLIVF